MENNNKEKVISGILIVLLLFLLNPFKFFMPSLMVMLLTIILVAIFAIYASFVLREKPRDERENMHQMFADRLAFLVGAGLLIFGIVLQGLKHSIDPWLIYILGAMILGKLFGLIYTQNHY